MAWINQNPKVPYILALQLFMKDPWVDVQHTLQTSQYVWRLVSECDITTAPYMLGWWVYPDLGSLVNITQNSQIPSVVPYFRNLVVYKAYRLKDILIWSPALYLYLGLFCVILFRLRRKDWKYLIIYIPSILQSLVIMAFTLAVQFRYQYSVYLIAMWCLGLLFLPSLVHTKED
jgi:hypothetical protein